MAQGRCSAVLAMVAVVLVSASVVQGTLYSVGDAERWTVPDTPTFYTDWAATKNFTAGDTLLFVYNKAAHNVLSVTAADYTTCTLTSTNKVQTGNDTITLVAGMNYFLCGIPGHCGSGQKLSVNVSAATPGSPLPITPSPPTSPDTSKNAASGTTVTIFQVVVAAMVSLVALLAM